MDIMVEIGPRETLFGGKWALNLVLALNKKL